MELRWHSYRYYPYEKDLALREVRTLIAPESYKVVKHGISLNNPTNPDAAERLVYFAESFSEKKGLSTIQAKLERTNGNGLNKQSTRYSAHGLHDYKGKFNPQIAKAILNLLGVSKGAKVLDPFCGSGTSLLECVHLGVDVIGIDLNPLAVFLSNAKLSALETPACELASELKLICSRSETIHPRIIHNDRRSYLEKWFDIPVLEQIEKLKSAVGKCAPSHGDIFLAIASNLLRDYSQQDPHDLRIRRRKSPLPAKPFLTSFKEQASVFIERIKKTQEAIGTIPATGRAILADSRRVGEEVNGIKFDCALTSPPYATALPYIDTQRLSLVWLGLTEPKNIHDLEAQLVGSRETRGQNKKDLLSALHENHGKLPNELIKFCLRLQRAISESDGFRRRAVPMLLYRYFTGMAESLRSIHAVMKTGARFVLIVGKNHTRLGGKRYEIDTPKYLAQLGNSCGWVLEEMIPLQTYQRYGYHMNNAVNSEAMLILRTL